MKIRIQSIDTPNLNGRIYPRSEIEKLISSGANNIPGKIGMCYSTEPINVCDISHVVSDLKIEENYLVGTVNISKSPVGERLRELLDTDMIAFRMSGFGDVDDDGKTVKDFQLTYVNVVAKNEAA